MSNAIREMLTKWRAWITETDEIVKMHDTGVLKANDETASLMRNAANRLRKLADEVEKKHDA